MIFTKKYFQDKTVLILLTLNLFLMLFATTVVSLRLNSSSGQTHIGQYRPSLGIGAYKTGGIGEFIYLVIFMALVFVFHFLLSAKTYKLRRQFSVALLGMGTLLLVVALVVSNALLVLG
jgi:hypothetical protein